MSGSQRRGGPGRAGVVVLLVALLAGLLTAAVPTGSAQAATCPTSRPSVRAGSDPAAPGIDLDTTALTTVAALGRLPRPSSPLVDTRVAPTETTRYVVTARLVASRLEPDGDLALTLRAADGSQLLADVPAPECVPSTSPFRAGVVRVRADVEALLGALPVGAAPDVPVRVSGIGYFDRTGRTGGAPNAVALHPVLSFEAGHGPVLVDRTGGTDRYATAALVSADTFDPGVPAAFVATGTDFPDALAGSAAAAALGAPVLLVSPTAVPSVTAAELARLRPQRIFLLGGTGAVSVAVEAALGGVAPVERLAGAGRFGTAAAVSARFRAPDGPDVFVATGYGFPDALAGAAAAGRLGVSMLLVASTGVPVETAAELTRLRPARITVLGGTGVVPAAVEGQLASFAPAVRRLAGADRYATAAAISAAVFPTAARARLATGTGFADALAGGPAAARAPGPVLLAQPTCLPTVVAGELARLDVARVSLLGGTGSLSPDVAALRPCAVYLPPSPYVARVPLPVGCHTVGPESAGVKVYLVQKALGLVGHKERYDSATVSAVRAFQSRQRLPVTGRVDRVTWDALRTGYDFCIDRFTVQPTVAPTAPTSAHVAALLAQANAQVGRPYIWGGAGPIGYDCSGLALQAMYAGGRLVPGVTLDLHVQASFATARAIYSSTALPHVPLSQRRPGDLVFWYSDVSHMAVYLGGDRIVEAVRPSVRTASLWTHGNPLGTVVRPFP